MKIVISMVALCVLAWVAAPKASAQGIGTLPPPLNWLVVNANYPQPNPIQKDNCDFICAEGFTIGEPGTYVNRLDMSLVGTNFTTNNSALGTTSVPIDCTFTWSITTAFSNGAVGFTMISHTKTVAVQPNTGETNITPAVIPFTDTFQPVWIAPGNYYVTMNNGQPAMNGNPSTGCNADLAGGAQANPPANLDWNVSYLLSAPGVGPGFFGMFKTDPTTWGSLHGMFAFDLIGPVNFLPPVGGGPLQIARLVLAGPITPPTGGPVQGQVGFVNAQTGALLGPLTPISANLGPSQVQSVDLNLTPFASRVGQRIEVQPVVVQSPDAAGDTNPGPVQLSATVQMLDAVTGLETVLAPLAQPGGFVGANPGPVNVSSLSPQILAGGQTMRFDVMATGPDPCVAQVTFNDANGNPLVPSTSVNLPSGAGTTVDLNADTLGFALGTRIEVQPVITATAPAAAVPLNSVCNAAVEVFNHLTGRTQTHQNTTVGLPAVQSPAGTAGTP